MTSTVRTTLVDGAPATQLAVTDRGLAYGDGVFETMLCVDGKVPLLSRHLQRLRVSCRTLGIESVNDAEWESDIDQVLRNGKGEGSCVVKLIVTRGSGGAGYTPPATMRPSRIVQLLELNDAASSDNLHCEVLNTQLGSSRQLAGIKHLNRLEQVLAARELGERELQEGLLCNHHGFLIEAVSSNVVLVFDSKVVTPKLDTAGVRGIMRDYLIECGEQVGIVIEKDYVFTSAIEQADEIILCNSVRGVRRVATLGEKVMEQRSVFEKLHALACSAFRDECGISNA